MMLIGFCIPQPEFFLQIAMRRTFSFFSSSGSFDLSDLKKINRDNWL